MSESLEKKVHSLTEELIQTQELLSKSRDELGHLKKLFDEEKTFAMLQQKKANSLQDMVNTISQSKNIVDIFQKMRSILLDSFQIYSYTIFIINPEENNLYPYWISYHNKYDAMEDYRKNKIPLHVFNSPHSYVIKNNRSIYSNKIRPNIFDPFYTTKVAGEGSGLGLHICKQIIEKHNGTISVKSIPGSTIFTVTLPIG